jgi:hypothetical protein
MPHNYAQTYGKCQFCGADRVKNPKTGKIFCGDKCWLKNDAKFDAGTSAKPEYSPYSTTNPNVRPVASYSPTNDSVSRADFLKHANEVKTAFEKLSAKLHALEMLHVEGTEHQKGSHAKALEFHEASAPRGAMPDSEIPTINPEDVPF